jgi:hypothetical protein
MANATKNLRRPITTVINGHQCVMLTTGYVANAVGRTPWTIKHWQRIGLLPAPTLVLHPEVPSARRGLYPMSFVKCLAEIARRDYMDHRLDRADWQRFHAEVFAAYEKTILPLLKRSVIEPNPQPETEVTDPRPFLLQ